jgi:uncharacterized protein YndB with AHSA1/START domain
MAEGWQARPRRGYHPGMEKLRFEIDIVAPVQTVWSTMLDDATYRQWSSAFNPGSYYTGGWELGDTIRFLGPNPDGSTDGDEDGIVGTIVANRPNEFVSIEYTGMVVNGEDDTTSEGSRLFAGTHENYSFGESNGITTVVVVLDAADEYAPMFREMWPVALDRLRDLAERADAPNRERLGSDGRQRG